MGLSRQVSLDEWLFPSPRNLPEPGIKLMIPALAGGFLTTEPTREALGKNGYMCMYGWVPLLFTWNYHSILNQLYSNKNIFSLKKALRYNSVQFSRSVVSNSLQPHVLQHAGLPVHHQLPEFTQTHVHWVSDAIQPSHPLSSPSCPTFSLSQHQSLFKWVSSSH